MIRSGGIAINWKSVLCEFAFSSPCVFRFVPSVSFLTEILFLTAAAVITTGPEPIKNFSSKIYATHVLSILIGCSKTSINKSALK